MRFVLYIVIYQQVSLRAGRGQYDGGDGRPLVQRLSSAGQSALRPGVSIRSAR
jgi:hypothetical protein